MKKRVITAGMLIFAGLALIAGALFAVGFDISKLSTVKYETNTYTAETDFTHIEIDSAESDILLVPATDGKVSVVCVEREKVRHTVHVENGALKIGVEDRRGWYDHLTFFTKELSVTVYLPEARYTSLQIRGSTGDVTVPAAFSFDNMEIRTSTGDVFCGASADGQIRIETSTGNIRLSDLRTKSVALTLSTGDAELSSVVCTGTLSIDLSTGKTKLTNVSCDQLATAATTGDITLKDTVAAGHMRIERDTGAVRFENSDAGSIAVRTTTGDVTGTLRTEKMFITKTSTGDIRVPDSVTGGRCEITTSTGDIEIRFGSH